jgi:hypothetical protein
MSILILSSTLVLSNPLPKTSATTVTANSVQIDHSNDYMSVTNPDGSTSLVPYILSQTSTSVNVQTKQGSFVYNNGTCNFAFYNSTSVSGTPIIPSDSYLVKAESNSTTTWIPVNVINNAACSTKIFADGTNITLESTKSVPSIGVFQVNYTKHPDAGFKLTFKATNQNPLWTNYHFGITETLAVPTHVILDNTPYDLSLYNNTSFSRTLIRSNHFQIINLGQRLWYDMGLGWNNTNDVTISYKNNQASVSIDYTYGTPVVQPNQSFIVDPSITKDTSGVSTFYVSGGSTSFTSSSFTIGSNSNELLIVGVSNYKAGNTPSDFSSVQLDAPTGPTLTPLSGTDIVSTGTNNDRVAVYYLTNPSSGSHTITLTTASSVTDAGIGWLAVYNAQGMQNGASAQGTNSAVSLSVTALQSTSWTFAHYAATSTGSIGCANTQDWNNNVNAILYGCHNSSPTVGSNGMFTGNTVSEWAASGGEVCVTGGTCTSITLSPASGPVGTTVTVSGSGFATTSAITIKYNGVVQTTTGTCTTDTSGNLPSSNNCAFTVPTSSGSNTVTATDASAHSASAIFTVSSGSSITSINSQTGPAVNIVRGAVGNITITNSTNQIAVNLGSNAVVTGGAAQTISKQMSFSGNVGIGTTSPGYKLDVTGNLRLSGNIISSNSSATSIIAPNGICIGKC